MDELARLERAIEKLLSKIEGGSELLPDFKNLIEAVRMKKGANGRGKILKEAVKRFEEVLENISDLTEVQKVEVINQEKLKFPEIQKVEVINQKELEFPEVQKVEVTNKDEVQKVEVVNQEKLEFPKVQKVEVVNQKEPKIFLQQKEVEKILKRLIEIQEKTKDEISRLEKLSDFSTPDKYLSVRLTDGRNFYKAISELISVTRGLSEAYSFKDSANKPQRGLVDEDGHVQVDVLSGGGGGTLRKDGEVISATDVGSLFVGKDPTGKARFLAVEEDGRLSTTTTANVSIEEPLNIDGMVSISGVLPTKVLPASGTFSIASIDGVRKVGVTADGKLMTDASVSIQEPLTVDGMVSISGTPTVAVTSFPDNEPFNLAQYGGVAVGAGNAIHVRPGTGATFDISDRAARELGRVSVVEPLTVDGQVSVSGTVQVAATDLDIRNLSASQDSVDISDRANRDMGKIDIAGFDVSLPAGTNVIGSVDVTDKTSRQLGVVQVSGVAYTPVLEQNLFTPPVINQNLISPTVSGRQLFITDILVSVSGICSKVELWSANQRKRLYHLRDGGGVVENLTTPIMLGKNWGLDVRIDGGIEVFVSVQGYEK